MAASALGIGLAPFVAAQQAEPEFRALLFTKVADGAYEHDSIPAAVDMITALGEDHNFEVVHSEDSTVFNDADLATFDVIVMAQNGGMVWDTDAQRQAVRTYVNNGGGIAAVHNATDMNIESDFPWWDDFVNGGSHMTEHSAGGLTATTHRIDNVHASTKDLPERWEMADEWYNFHPTMRGHVHSLLEVDEDTYDPGRQAMGTDHPISWCRDAEGGRVWATAMGHSSATYSDPQFQQHVLGGIQTAAGAISADCKATMDAGFEKVTLDDTTEAPTSLDIAPDGRVFYSEILGDIKMYDPETGSISTAIELSVYSGGEDGVSSLVLAPDFADTGHMYVYYSPADNREFNRVSRFTVRGDTVDRSSEVVVMEIPASRKEEPGHTGGYLDFGPNGNLYIGVGDDTNPFQSSGYAPIDERSGRQLFDAQRTSANTNDLRGKILRVHPEADGTYTVPEGNMFAPGTEKTKPEIYAMGFRNAFRFNVASDGTLYLADYGPDAGSDNADRGPGALVEWNVITEPGFYGWPYCVANGIPFNDYDFEAETSGPKFDCAKPVNNSPNNTGLTDLPAAKQPTVWYGNGANGNAFPEMGTGGEAPMAGPRYEYDPNLQSETKFPEFYDGKPFFYEWARNRIFLFNQDSAGGLLSIDPWYVSNTPLAPMDMKFGPDGALYMVEWGGGYGRDNPDSGIYRIDYTQGNRRPKAHTSATPSSGQAPLDVAFSSEGSVDPEGEQVSYSWNFGDGATSTEANPKHVFTENGVYQVQLTVTDPGGKAGISNVSVTVGNTAPSVDLAAPVDGGFFDFGDRVVFDATITDPEEQVDCSKAVLRVSLGHDSHDHLIDTINACEGELATQHDEGHADADVFYTVEASYTDGGANGQPTLTSRDLAVLQPKHKQAEYHDRQSGVTVQEDPAAESGKRVGDVSDGDWIAFDPVNLHQIDGIAARVQGSSTGGSIELRAGSPDGALVATIPVPQTSGYVTVPPVDVTNPGGSTSLHAVFQTTANNQFTVDSFHFVGKGVSVNSAPYVAVNATSTSGSAPLEVEFATTVSDPEGDEPFSYAWDLGDGTTSTEANPTHTYTEEGTYTAKVTVTDAAKRSKSVSTQIVVAPPPMPPIECVDPGASDGRSDEFESDRLDGCRWNSVVRPDLESMRMADGVLSVDTLSGDIAGGTNGDSKNFVLQAAPGGDWTLETRMRAPLVERYQLAGFMVYGNDDDYVKFDVVAFNAPGGVVDLRAELVSENNGKFGEGGQRMVTLGAGAESGWWHLKLTKSGNNYTGWVSDGGSEWTSLGTAVTNEVPNPKFGLMAIGPQQTGDPVTVDFDWFRVTPAATSPMPAIECADPNAPVARNDEFASDRLDGCRWNSVVRPDLESMRMANGVLSVDTLSGDIAGGTNGDSKNFVLRSAPSGDWTVETRMRAPLVERYQLGGFMVYGNDDDYVKFDVVAFNRPGGAVDLRAELVSENNGKFGEGGQRLVSLGSGAKSGWWNLRLTKSGNDYSGWISDGGSEWTSLGTAVTNEVPSPKFGLMAIGPQQTRDPVTIDFDWFRLIPPPMPAIECADPTAPVARNDEFESDRLDGCRWSSVVRPDLTSMRMADGMLSVDTLSGDIAGGTNGDSKNFVLQPAPGGDWTVETRMRAPLVERYQLGGFMVYGDDDDYVKFDVVAFNAPGGTVDLRAELVSEAGGKFGEGGQRLVTLGSGAKSGWWNLKLTKSGNDYSGWISGDGTEWTSLGTAVTNEVPNPKFGLMAIGPQQTRGPVTIDFDWFRVAGEDADGPAVTAKITPEAGQSGWYTTSPTVTLEADDGAGSGVATTEYRVDGGEWVGYGEPVLVTAEGAHTFEYRSADRVGNTSPVGAVEVKVDATAPALELLGVSDGVTYGHSEDRAVDWAASDATAGLGEVTATFDGAAVAKGTSLRFPQLALGTHTLVVRALDGAGHVTEKSVVFTIGTSITDLRAMLDRFEAENKVTRSAAVVLDTKLAQANREALRGSTARAVSWLDTFRESVQSLVPEVEVGTVLRADAAVVAEGLATAA
ncbi:PKD repeat protein/glucose/arabinose dehydrogenase [Saccharothrix ecbatanensis]|uniref:PKD repeat protein/glucose/arabinose dehydrogenase n=1 Tax=Saccharothrix ecbatanensis TaxID=1105145 RepID=A0A7W9M117_9PSEU|nr:ThuA domain-containing protein [Saccharothrix ecbatanensis]MBB5803504.1 PKD repeat protein/glucose/arabinose dehydrogenase [Saccharothrix ecbatanensis]